MPGNGVVGMDLEEPPHWFPRWLYQLTCSPLPPNSTYVPVYFVLASTCCSWFSIIILYVYECFAYMYVCVLPVCLVPVVPVVPVEV